VNKTIRQYWQHRKSGDIYAVELVERFGRMRVSGACGPLHHTEVTAANLPEFHYGDDYDLITDLDTHQDDYTLKET